MFTDLLIMATQDSETTVTVSKHLAEKLPELKQLEGLLSCPVCYEPLSHPTSSPCHHTFCSLCIRKYLQFKQACPCCHLTLHEPDLRPDKTAEYMIPVFQSLVTRLESGADKQYRNITEMSSDKENSSPNINQTDKDHGARSSQKQTCSYCKVSVSSKNFDVHMRNCRDSSTIKPETVTVKKKAQPLPKMVYALMKDAQLKKLCKDYGLSSSGKTRDLTSRLQRYTLLYNTEILLENPRTKLEIRMQVNILNC